MKRAIVAVVATFLLAGCTPEVKESKQESKQAIKQTENIQKSEKIFTNQDVAYMNIVRKSLETFTGVITEMSKLMQQADKDPSLGQDEEWLGKLRGCFMAIALQSELLKTMDNDVPERYENVHNNLKQSFDLMVEGGDELVQAIQNNMDMEIFNSSMKTMAESNQKMNEVTEELEKINSK